MALCGIISKHPEELPNIDCEAVIRHAIKLYTDEVVSLAFRIMINIGKSVGSFGGVLYKTRIF